MAKIRSKDTKPEEYICKKLYENGYRYRKNYAKITGHPDVWLGKYNTAIFVNGCYWHRHQGCKYAYAPKSKVDFWEEKFRKNIERDETVKRELAGCGIKILIIWECTIKKMYRSGEFESIVLANIDSFLSDEEWYLEL